MSAPRSLSSHFCWSLSYPKSLNTGKLSKYAQFLFAGFCLRLIHWYQAVSHIPGLRVPFHQLGLPGALLRTAWWNPAGFDSLWVRRNGCKHLYFSFCEPSGWRVACKCTSTTEAILSPSSLSVLLRVDQHYTPPTSMSHDKLLAEVINPVLSSRRPRARLCCSFFSPLLPCSYRFLLIKNIGYGVWI